MKIQTYQLGLLLALCLCSSCGIFRAAWHLVPETDDYRHDPQRPVVASAEPFRFIENNGTDDLGKRIGITYQRVQNHVRLESFVEMFGTEAFVIIRNDTVLYERYPNGHSPDQPVTTFSVSKAVMTSLVGAAIQQGHLRSLDQTVGEVLPEWQGRDLGTVTVQQLLQHTSGIRFTEKIVNLNSDQVQFYYGKNLRRRMARRQLVHPPGEHFQYHSANTQLLGMMLEAASGQTLSAYLETQLWQPLGMEAPAFWSLDRKDEKAIERAFCCFQAQAIDFAKLGRLWLHDGNWQGQQLLPPGWTDGLLSTTQPTCGRYHCGFTTAGSGCERAYYASGLLGQFIYVVPEKNLLILRFGEHKKGYSTNLWRDVFAQVAAEL